MEESTKLVDESTEALWYVVHTYSGYENKVANDLQTMVENRHLQDLICDIKVPGEMVPEIDKNGKQKKVEHKLFPGYVLVKMVMNDDTWYVVRNTRGCTGFVGPASKPVPSLPKKWRRWVWRRLHRLPLTSMSAIPCRSPQVLWKALWALWRPLIPRTSK